MFSEQNLKGRKALVTGGSQRIGEAIVRALHRVGATIIIHYHQSQSAAQSLAAELNAERADSAFTVSADLGQDDLSLFLKTVLEKADGLDLLVNNASIFFPTHLDPKGQEAWQKLMQINAFAPYQLSLLAAEALAKNQGAIVNIVDIHAEKPLKHYGAYSQSKAALRQQTLSLALELAPAVRVNAVAPGAILWPQNKASLSEDSKAQILEHIALKRAGTAEDIAEAVLYLALAQYVTGIILPVDGGRLLAK